MRKSPQLVFVISKHWRHFNTLNISVDTRIDARFQIWINVAQEILITFISSGMEKHNYNFLPNSFNYCFFFFQNSCVCSINVSFYGAQGNEKWEKMQGKSIN